MIQFVTGIPGSGKSYYGVFYIIVNFLRNRKYSKYKKYAISKTEYKACLTNLNEFKFNEFENTYKFDFDEFKKILKHLHMCKKRGFTDNELIEEVDKITDTKFVNTLIVIDECQDYLKKLDDTLEWWLSYHRHFYQDIILITQDIPLVHKNYKVFTEFFYKARPASRKLFNTSMIYNKFTGYQMFKTQQADTKKIPIIKESFELYHSGDNNTQKSLVLHYLLLSLGIFAFLIIAGYFYINSLSSSPQKVVNDNNNKQSNSIIPKRAATTPTKDFKDSQYFEMICNKNLCFINGNVYEKSYLFYILNNEYETKFLKVVNNKYAIKTTDKFNLFEKRGKNENNEENDLFTSVTDSFTSK